MLAKSASGALDLRADRDGAEISRARSSALKERGFLLVGLDSSGESDLADVPLRAPLALVLGAEGKGLRQLTRETCDACRAARPAGRDQEPQRLERRGDRALCRH